MLERPRTAGERRSRGKDEGEKYLQDESSIKTPGRASFFNTDARPLTAAGQDADGTGLMLSPSSRSRSKGRTRGVKSLGALGEDKEVGFVGDLSSGSGSNANINTGDQASLAVVGKHLGSRNVGNLSRSTSNVYIESPYRKSREAEQKSARLYRGRHLPRNNGGKKPLRPKTAPSNRDGSGAASCGQILTMTLLSNWSRMLSGSLEFKFWMPCRNLLP